MLYLNYMNFCSVITNLKSKMVPPRSDLGGTITRGLTSGETSNKIKTLFSLGLTSGKVNLIRKYGKWKVVMATILVLVGTNTYFTLAATLKLPPSNLGLVGYWTMNEDYNRDYSGLVNNFTVNGTCLSTSSDSVSGGISITNWATCGGGVQKLGYLSIGDILNSASEFTFVAWVKGTGILWSGAPIFWFQANAGGAFLDKYTGSWVNIATGSGGGSSSGWRQLVLTKNSAGGVKIYSNTVEIASSTSQTFYTPTSQTVGRYAVYDDSGYHFTGKIDEIRLYKRILSTDEIKNLYTIKTTKANTSTTNKNTSGLVGYWTFDGADTTTTTATDKSGSGNNGALTNGPTVALGKIGQSLLFNGVNQYVNITKTLSVPLTVSAWVKLPNLSKSLNTLINTSTHTTLVISLNRLGGGETYVYIGNGSSWYATPAIISSTNMVANKWYHVVFTSDGIISKLYINSSQVGSSAFIPSGFGTQTYIGTIIIAGGEYFKGNIDDYRIYNKALSTTEIKQLYNTGVGTQVNSAQNSTPSSSLSTGLVGYWPFNGPDISGTTAYDRSTSGNNGTLTNGPTIAIGKIGQALKFDGSTQYIQTSSASIPVGGQNYTVSVWFLATDQISAYRELVAQWTNANSGNSFFLGTTLNTHIRFSDNWNDVDIGTWTTGKWHHLVAVSTTNNAYIYLDNVLKATKGSALTYSGVGPIVIGRQGTLNAEYWKGNIDEVRIYNRTLSTSEINQLYLLGK